MLFTTIIACLPLLGSALAVPSADEKATSSLLTGEPGKATLLTGDRLADGTRNFPWLNLQSTLLPDLSVYHSTAAVQQEIVNMATSCSSFMTHSTEAGGVHVATFTDASATGPKSKLFYNFAIHGREYITSEVALTLMSKLCDGSDRSKALLGKAHIQMIPLLNIAGRTKVESGAQCSSQRKNSNDVDLNRNFDIMWAMGSGDHSAEDYHGTAAMSEPETALLNSLVTNFSPKVFVDVHSGDTTMMHPYSYVASDAPKADGMKDLIAHVKQKVFNNNIRTGAASTTLSPPYTAAGTTLDFFYEKKKIPYAFTFEVYGLQGKQASSTSSFISGEKEEVMDAVVPNPNIPEAAFLLAGAKRDNGTAAIQPLVAAKRDNGTIAAVRSADTQPKRRDNGTLAATSSSNLLNLSPSDMSLKDCFKYFNPVTSTGVKQTSEQWAEALLTVAEYAVSNSII